MSWVCELTEDAKKDLRDVPKAIQERVARVMMQMGTDPFQGKEWRGVFRRRIGDYRLLFTASRE
jgi:mRNA-degrading endonuclease RelE of RelBE toxin-antitoxin system